MQLIPSTYHDGDVSGWHTDDEAKLYFCNQTPTENPKRRNNPPPESISAFVIGRVGEPSSINIPIALLTFLGAGLFGEPRPSSSAGLKWT